MFLLNKHIKAETHFVGRYTSAFPAHFDKSKDREASQEMVKNNHGHYTSQFLLFSPFCFIFLNSVQLQTSFGLGHSGLQNVLLSKLLRM